MNEHQSIIQVPGFIFSSGPHEEFTIRLLDYVSSKIHNFEEVASKHREGLASGVYGKLTFTQLCFKELPEMIFEPFQPEIGEKVYWKSGEFHNQGIFMYENQGTETSKVRMYQRGEQKVSMLIDVNSDLLQPFSDKPNHIGCILEQ